MKKLLLMLLIPFSAFSSVKYNEETNMYYSTRSYDFINKMKYHILADYCFLLIDNALNQDIDLKDIINHIKEVLVFEDSIEADLLYDDIQEFLGDL